jgi:uncharacterized protein (TIGR02453 family)
MPAPAGIPTALPWVCVSRDYDATMTTGFPGFSPKAITFLRQLEKNNSRDWFQPRKDQFEELLRQPMLELAGLVGEQLRTFAVDHVIPANKAVHRIYRDVRFSKDKSPYKTNISAMFPRRGLSKLAGGAYYFSLSADEFGIFGGIYMPEPTDLKVIREEIDKNPAGFRKIVENPKMIKITGPLRGDKLARLPKGFDEDHPAIDLLRNKQFYYYTSLPAKAATEVGLDKVLIKQFKVMAPAVDYLNGLLLRAAKGDEEEEQLPKRPKPMF